MGFHINQYSMPSLNTYETAKEHFKNCGQNHNLKRYEKFKYMKKT